jgi:hypothetical protein
MCVSVSDENKKAVVHPEAYSVQYTPHSMFFGTTGGDSEILGVVTTV